MKATITVTSQSVTLEAAVEALARAMGWWLDGHDTSKPDSRRWTLYATEAGEFLLKSWTGASMSVVDEEWRLPPREAMLVLRCALLGTTRVRCPGCEGSLVSKVIPDGMTDGQKVAWSRIGGGWTTLSKRLRRHAETLARRHPDVVQRLRGTVYRYRRRPCPTCTGPAVECDHCTNGLENRGYGDVGDCSACGGGGKVPGPSTGHVDRPWAEVLLGAMPRPGLGLMPSPASYRDVRGTEPGDPGDPEARTLLTVNADELQANGDPLGLWLALYLGQQPCEARSCKDGQTPVKLGPAIQGHDGQVVYPIIETAPCPRCAGSGLALGAHDRALAEAGERLAEQLGVAAVGPA